LVPGSSPGGRTFIKRPFLIKEWAFFCVYHQNDRKYLETSHFISRKQLDAKFKIKDKFLNKIIEGTLDDYRETISQLGNKLDFFSVKH